MSKRALATLPLALALVAAACGTAATTPSPTAFTNATTASPTATATPTASQGPQARTPTPVAATNASDLVARLDAFGELCCPVPVAVITADGRVVTATDAGAFVERRITTAAAQRIRSDLLASGLFANDQALPAEPIPGATAGQLPISGYNLRVWNGSAVVRLQWVTIPPDRAASYRTSPARTRAEQLATQLRVPEQWLAADAWTAASPRPYSASAYRLTLIDVPAAGSLPTINASTWPFTILPAAFGDPLKELPPIPAGPGEARCILLTSVDVRAVRDALGRAGATLAAGPPRFEFNTVIASGRSGIATQLFAEPLLPDQPGCTAGY
jgi:hypothetical protein